MSNPSGNVPDNTLASHGTPDMAHLSQEDKVALPKSKGFSDENIALPSTSRSISITRPQYSFPLNEKYLNKTTQIMHPGNYHKPDEDISGLGVFGSLVSVVSTMAFSFIGGTIFGLWAHDKSPEEIVGFDKGSVFPVEDTSITCDTLEGKRSESAKALEDCLEKISSQANEESRKIYTLIHKILDKVTNERNDCVRILDEIKVIQTKIDSFTIVLSDLAMSVTELKKGIAKTKVDNGEVGTPVSCEIEKELD